MRCGLMWAHAKNRETLDFTGKTKKQAMGIEPTFSAWKADVLPLNHACVCKCSEPESNQRHEDFQSSALPTELSEQIFTLQKLLYHTILNYQAFFHLFSSAYFKKNQGFFHEDE